MPKSELPTIDQAIKQVLEKLDGPIETREFIKMVLEIRPSSAKGAANSIRNNMSGFEGDLLGYPDKKTVVPLRIAMPGLRFRIPIGRIEVNRGVLFVFPSFEGFFTRRQDLEKIELLDEKAQQLPTRIVSVKQKVTSLLGETESENEAFDLANWFRAHKADRDDSIIVTIESWEPKCFKLELEPRKERRRHNNDIESKDKELSDIIFGMLEESASESIMHHRIIPSVYIRLSDPRGYPGNHWAEVINHDPRMKWNGFTITYKENLNMLEAFLMRDKPRVQKQRIVPQQSDQVYRFRAALKHRQGLWRIIEIQGKQTLSEFDDILRDAFNHDTSDHMSGFWKQVRRGHGNRFREVDLGDVNPIGGGSGADVRIAELDLQVGDRIKYVYDFGDWIEHEITLEGMDAPDGRRKYPYIASKNKPEYHYCEHCKSKGRQTVATYICIECSDEKQREVLVCDDCLDKHHEEHYADEITY